MKVGTDDGRASFTELTPEQFIQAQEVLADAGVSYEYSPDDETWVTLANDVPDAKVDILIKAIG